MIKMIKWYWVDSGFGCGGIKTIKNRIVLTAPIFKRWRGKLLASLPLSWIIKELEHEGGEAKIIDDG